MLEVKNIRKTFGTLVAVDDLSFTAEEGKIYGILGTNGAGKTTTFRMILGLLEPDNGTILYNGKKIDYTTSPEIGFLVEERALLVKEKLCDMVTFFCKLKGMEYSVINERLDYWLDRFNLTEFKNKKIKELSKGNQQKVQFISAIINDPKLLILDEPFSGMDPLNIEKMIIIIRELQKKGTTIIFSSHRIDHVELFCEELTVLVEGKVVLSGIINDIKKEYKQKVIKLEADQVNVEELLKVKGVNRVENNVNEYVIHIDEISFQKDVFDYIKTLKNVRKFIIEEASLSEIFIEKVGLAYDK